MHLDVLVIGGGAVGLAIARALRLQGREVVVIEQRGQVGTETSARNSGVIHAGLYYSPGSLKARLCVEGKQRLYRFCQEFDVLHRRLGKLVVATHEDDVARLKALMERARSNGVEDVRFLTSGDAKALEPDLTCLAACLSPSSGFVDSDAFVRALEADFLDKGGDIALQTTAVRLESRSGELVVLTRTGAGDETELTANLIINAAGHGASQLAATLAYPGGYAPPPVFLGKGHYFYLSGKAPFTHLIYPMPTASGLGIHFSLDAAGQARFGPDVEWVETFSYGFDGDNKARQERFEVDIRRYWPGLAEGALTPGFTGIRPKLQRPGGPAQDFAIHGPDQHGVPGLVSLMGIDSPGLTSSLAIAAYVERLAVSKAKA